LRPFSETRGIYRSTDGGDSWTVLAPGNVFTGPQALTIQRIVVPAHDVLLVGTNTGLLRSVDGGQHFGANAPLFNDGKPVLGGYISDIKVDTATPTTIYAAAVPASGGAIYRSTDGGVTFSPTPIFSSSSLPPTNPPTVLGFIVLTQSTNPNNQTFYANVQVGNQAASMVKSTDGGVTWNVVAANPFPGELQNFYDQTIGVDPQDPNRVYFGLRALYESKDGGATGLSPSNRTDLNKVHADQHALVFSPKSHWAVVHRLASTTGRTGGSPRPPTRGQRGRCSMTASRRSSSTRSISVAAARRTTSSRMARPRTLDSAATTAPA
jgi:photosystem II stability/assembly factor-like uncharacterized protein